MDAMISKMTPTSGILFGIFTTIAINRISNLLHNAQFIYPKNVIDSKSSYHFWRYRNFLISFIHASITGIGSLLCVLANPMLLFNVIDTHSDWGYLLTSFSLGYFIYDTIEMAAYIKKKGTFELIIHHFLVISCFLNTIIFKRFIGYNMIALMVEISNIFLHFRQLLLLSNFSKSTTIYRYNCILNLVLFVLVRGSCMSWLWYTLILFYDQLPLITRVVAFTSMIGISITTIILFRRILNSDFLNLNTSTKAFSNGVMNGTNDKNKQDDDDFNYEGRTDFNHKTN